uniref:MAM domain-containing protein n=1 Tax=Steinernema glaseri TaxID=37863 RepID=A0A1I7ZVV9_9BILA
MGEFTPFSKALQCSAFVTMWKLSHRLALLSFSLIANVRACLPGTPGLYQPFYSGSYAGVPSPYYGRGPYRTQQSRDPSSVGTTSLLNCQIFDDGCRWSNTNQDDMDWKISSSSPEADHWLPGLAVSNLPDRNAAALISPPRNGWENGQLVSDPLPCMNAPLRFTATVWHSLAENEYEQPRLQVCTKNVDANIIPTNCASFPIQNGVPSSIKLRLPKNPEAPTHLIILGDNFVSPRGGAIFIQDISVDGHLNCHRNEETQFVPGSAITGRNTFDRNEISNSLDEFSHIPQPFRAPAKIANHDDVFETCLTLSCNPAEADCKWTMVSPDKWEVALQQRMANPLTGVHVPPSGESGFLVASFRTGSRRPYVMSSGPISVPQTGDRGLFFCFYEYLATEGLRLALCADRIGSRCFYQRKTLSIQSVDQNRRWNYKCVALPPGQYEINVIAENVGENRGDVGFVPTRVARHQDGLDTAC